MKIHIVMHESFEAPAALVTWAESKGAEVSYTRCYLGDAFPESTDFDFLVVMGGPQSPDTSKEESPHFDGQAEMEFIKRAIDAGKYVWGACLGAQLIGQALGAKYDHSPQREIGVFPISLTEEGKQDPLFVGFPDNFQVGHWHGDMPGLTVDSKVLATSEGCPRQIVRYTEKVYGFQCHFEFTPEAIEGMITNCAEELERYKDLPFVQSQEELRANDYSEMNKLLFQFLDRFTSQG